ncbi:clustered mitochondria protein-like [Asparagus officinalis]|nr:clustered mitochondria protein-like [Asparagus officinalis]
MAGKSNKAKNRGKPSNLNPSSLESDPKPYDSTLSSNNGGVVSETANSIGNEVMESSNHVANGTVENKVKDGNEDAGDTSAATAKKAEGELRLYPISVKTQSGERLELQLSPGDSVMDIRQFLLDAPETCFYTCYDLILHTKDGSVHHLEDYNEISEVADITIGGCFLEMVAALYDERSIRSHVRRTRELLSLSNLHVSLSTSLAMQQESAQQKNQDTKVETPEPEGLGFMEDLTFSPSNLVVSSPKDIKCMESITFSSFNPPPSHRRLAGDLIYLDAATLEGNKYCITGTTKGFHVNSSTGVVLNPKPLKPAFEATTLIGLLQKISAKFKKGFREILEWKASTHPFENVQALLPPNLWLGIYPVPDHKRDAARAEDAFSLSYGSELIGMQRDWNEELQSCREFPHTTLQERILRDRALYKVTCDFVDAATNGAIGVISRCIPPINPTDPECFHMYVHNNIFFSFAVDADLGLISKGQTSTISKAAVHYKNSAPLSTSSVKASSTSGRGCNGETNAYDSARTEIEGLVDDNLSAASDAQIADSEQATYASANNDLKGTRAYQEADVPGLYNLAMAIVDYRGHRVVAQSIIPGILQGDKSDSLLYGSVDNGKKICWSESFHSKVLEAAKNLHLKEHTVVDGSGNVVKLAAPVECKGIVGSDDRHYLLDLMRVTPRDSNCTGPGSRFCVLRPELVTSFCQDEATKASSQAVTEEVQVAPDSQNTIADLTETSTNVHKEASEEYASAMDDTCKPSAEILLNPNVLMEFKLGGSEEEIAADEVYVRKAGSYLTDIVIPKFVHDLCNLEISPMDGQTLTDNLHFYGINVRYLGKVANMTKHLPHLWDLCTTEIIVRSAKHILKDTLRDSQDHDLGPAISHFFNCFIGNVLPASEKSIADNLQQKPQKKDHSNFPSSRKSNKGKIKWSNGCRTNQSEYMCLTSEEIWSHIEEFAKVKYQFVLPDDAKSQVNKISVVRNLCQKVGITIASRKYDLASALPFQTSDILNLQPVVKHSAPSCSEARDLMEAGKSRLAEGMLNEAYTLFSEAFAILQQVTGPMHREVATCCRYLAMVLYHAGDLTGAIVQQHKELIINERCLGLDHPDTAHSYTNMALFYHGLTQTELALRHMSRTLLLLSLSSGPDHPDVAATFINIAMMYQDFGKMDTALRYLQEALKKNERLLGPEHIQTAVCYHALAIAFNCMGAYKLSLQHEKKTYDILSRQLGEEDSRTRESANWINTFKVREMQVNAQKQKGQSLSSAQKAVDILKAHPNLVQALQATNAGSANATSSSLNKSLNAALIGESISRGRDERAAKAAAEVRKKAAARGLLVRQNVAPVQCLPLTQLLNIINNTSTATEASQSTETKDSSESLASNGAVIDDKGTNGSAEERAPVGLGSGLASLESKKQKKGPKNV